MSLIQYEDNSNEVQISKMNKEKETHATAVIDHKIFTRDGLIVATTPLSVNEKKLKRKTKTKAYK